jgi:DNA-binding NtrC family response regulator
VDDEALVRWSLTETFAKAGYEVLEAGTSRAARAALHDPAHPISAIVLDLKLPDGQGLDVLEEARLTNQFCPVVVITAYGSTEAVDRAITLGAVAIIPKPFDLDQLLDVVKRACPLA